VTRTAAGETCVACHTEQHAEMLEDWRQLLDSEVAGAQEYETEVLALFEELKPELSAEKLGEAEQGLKNGRELLDIVRYGNGVHNKKYAIMILDEAFGNFDGAMGILEDAQ
jgi:hypothetical protein